MDEGWIKIYRKILDNPIASKPAWAWLWVYLLLSANHEDKQIIFNNKPMVVKRGQLITGLLSLHEETKLGIQSIRSALGYLKLTHQVTINTTSKFSVITILNYDYYQQSNTLSNKLATRQQQASNTPATTNKNIRIKEYKNNILLSDKQKEPSKTSKTWTRPEPSKWSNLQKIVFHLEDVLQTKITNWGKQGTAYKLMVSAGYTDEQIIKAISYLSQDEFFRDKGFDLMTVSNQIPLLKAKARRIYEQHQVN